MSVEAIILAVYLVGCIGVGALASRRAATSSEEYWVGGRRTGPVINAVAIMATLASGGSIVGVMGYAYGLGIPATLALFAGAVVGFPLASVLVAAPLRRFGRFTITDFLAWRFPHAVVRTLVPLLIVASFTAYIVAQLKAAGVTAEVLLGVEYNQAIIVSTIVFVAYVSFGGMHAITWTDVVQGAIMLVLVLGTAAWLAGTEGLAVLPRAAEAMPELGQASGFGRSSMLGSFLLWATAIPVVPHVVMRVYTARDAHGAKLALNLAMVGYSAIVLAAVFVIVPVGVLDAPALQDPDRVFHMVVEQRLPPFARGVAVAAVLAAVMSTTDALLLACSSAIAHDLIASRRPPERPLSAAQLARLNRGIVAAVGAVAAVLALWPPALLTELYSAAIGVLSASLFVPLVAGVWWKRASTRGGVAAIVAGAVVYLLVQLDPLGFDAPSFTAILFALPASALGMILGSLGGGEPDEALRAQVDRLHKG